MNLTPHLLAVVALFSPILPAQDAAKTSPAAASVQDGWTEGIGRAPGYRAALAQALEDAVAKRCGVRIARGAGLRSRLAVVAAEGDEGRWPREAELQQEWVVQQLDGFVETYEVVRQEKQADGGVEVAVRARIAAFEPGKEPFVLELVDDGLAKYRLERFEEGAEAPFARTEGEYAGRSLRDNLRATKRVKFAARSAGVAAGADAAPGERAKQGRQLVASHRVVVEWQPMQFRSVVERPNRARPSSRPRPQFLAAGSVRATVRVVDLVENIETLAQPLTIDLPIPLETPAEDLAAAAVRLADAANAAVAETVFFALQPPVVTRKWAADGGEWLVEVALAKRLATAYDAFAVGVMGSLATPDWRPLGRAVFVGGAESSSTFRLVDVADPALVEVGVAEVRPARK